MILAPSACGRGSFRPFLKRQYTTLLLAFLKDLQFTGIFAEISFYCVVKVELLDLPG